MVGVVCLLLFLWLLANQNHSRCIARTHSREKKQQAKVVSYYIRRSHRDIVYLFKLATDWLHIHNSHTVSFTSVQTNNKCTDSLSRTRLFVVTFFCRSFCLVAWAHVSHPLSHNYNTVPSAKLFEIFRFSRSFRLKFKRNDSKITSHRIVSKVIENCAHLFVLVFVAVFSVKQFSVCAICSENNSAVKSFFK